MRRITRRWLLIGVTLGLFPALAYAKSDELRGVWKGNLGKQEIMACFNDEDNGGYYYLRYVTPISLNKKKLEPQWEEATDTVTGIWTQLVVKNDELSGLWQKPGELNTLPIQLKRVAQTTPHDPEANDQACKSDAYYAKLWEVQQKVITGKRENFNGIPYRHLKGNLLGTDDFVETIELLVETPQAATINALLHKAFQENMEAYFSCMFENSEYFYESSVNIEFLDKHWLSIREGTNGSCGGAHPFTGFSYRNFDLVNGKEVNLWTFFENAKRADASAEHDGYYFNYATHAGLNKIILSYYVPRKSENAEDKESDKQCQEAIEANDTYQLALRKKGIVFSTSFAHAIQACDEDIEVPYEKLLPFMTEQGKKVARLFMKPA